MDIEKMAQDTFNNLHKSVVLIICKLPDSPNFNTGSGFIIGKTQRGSYLVMTCQHVIRGFGPSVVPIIRVRIPNDDKDTEEYEAFILKGTKNDGVDKEFESEDFDLAIIEVYGVTREYQPLEFCDTEAIKDVRPETCVFILGYILQPMRPGTLCRLNLEPSVSPGLVSSPLRIKGDCKDVVYTTNSRHGTSGCPLIFCGGVLGVNYQQELGFQTCYARSLDTINATLKVWLQIKDNKTYTMKELIGILQMCG